MRRPCPKWAPLQVTEYDQEKTENLITKDTSVYEACRTRHEAVIRWYEQRDKALERGE